MGPNIHDRIDNDFKFHPATPESGPLHDSVRGLLKETAHRLVDLTPAGREQSLALTALEEAMHWANGAIAKK